MGTFRSRLLAAISAGALIAPLLVIAGPVPAAAVDTPTEWIDTSDRAAVLDAYRLEFERTEPDPEFTGDVSTCSAGTTSAEFRQSVVQRINWYRRMAGLGKVTDRVDYNSASQQTALMMAAQGSLSHSPGESWACFTPDGNTTASKSNLALGTYGIGAINAYVQDSGANNVEMGHRRTLLYPQLQEVGIGDIPSGPGNWASNTLRVFDDNLWAARPTVRQPEGFVSWPPSGYVPPQAVWGRWTFSIFGGDFTNATVSVNDAVGPIQTSILARRQSSSLTGRIAPEPSIVWSIGADNGSALMSTPTNGDRCYDVRVSGVSVRGALQPDYVYTTCVIDPSFVMASAQPAAPQAPCTPVAFATWTTPCWNPAAGNSSFVDVVRAWQRQPVRWLLDNGITTGVSVGRFDPEATLTRAQAATMIWRLAGSPAPPGNAPSFQDVPSGSWFHDPVAWMAASKITMGTGTGRFSPNAPASRAEMVTFLWRLVDSPQTAGTMPFGDLTATWQNDSVMWAAAVGVTSGTSSTAFSPNRPVTRGEAAALLARFATAITV